MPVGFSQLVNNISWAGIGQKFVGIVAGKLQKAFRPSAGMLGALQTNHSKKLITAEERQPTTGR